MNAFAAFLANLPSRRITAILMSLFVAILCGCSQTLRDYRSEVLSSEFSPDRSARASVVQTVYSPGGEHTRVMIDFLEDNCGLPAIDSDGINLGIQAKWLGNNQLEVMVPAGVIPRQSIKGSKLACGKQSVDVLLKVQPESVDTSISV